MEISWEEVQEIMKELETTDGFNYDRTFMFDLVNKYKNVPRELTYELHDIFTNHAYENSWSRRKLNTILHSIVIDIQNKDGER